MTRYKLAGSLLAIEPPSTAIDEVTMRDLSRDTSAVLARVIAGRRVIVTKRGAPVAVILEVEEALGMSATVVVTPQEAARRLFGEGLDRQFRVRRARGLSRGLDRRREGA
jgi:prevent-host-death family protein